ncbi:hypothetical protein DFH08DRAFT_978217 [Mycena albidolilacea]|uniref:F-box domain-containing protein n=1 Tax=Mycena albidolilacea TaxID=1033008 RepID=A0AAD6YZB0_9AGAR|nr:hypothetical protein DFH08DRAFT_978217 [Mycena albidolilacea]
MIPAAEISAALGELAADGMKICISDSYGEWEHEVWAYIAQAKAENVFRLKKLNYDRTLRLRQLDAILDPVARLPIELSSEVFLLLCFTDRDGAAWTRIALATTSLWAAVHINLGGNPPRGPGLRHLMPLWFHCARTRSLSISLSGEYFDCSVLNTVWRQVPRIAHLELRDEKGTGPSSIHPVLLWEPGTASPRPLAALETLAIWGTDTDPRTQPLPCVFHDVEVRFGPWVEKVVVLPKLRHLVFEGTVRGYPRYSRNVLDHLTLPALETLVGNAEGDQLLCLLTRSAPPLRDLVATKPRDLPIFVRCLRLIPGLSRLELWGIRSPIAEDLFEVLAHSGTPLLPQLSTLIIRLSAEYDLSETHTSFWPAALRALSSRRTTLRTFEVRLRNRLRPEWRPAPELVYGFRELMKGEMQVRIIRRDCCKKCEKVTYPLFE